MNRTITVYHGKLWPRVRRKWGQWWNDFALSRRKVAYRRTVGVPTTKTVGFVVGCQRSGTDMTIKTLDRSPDVDRFDEYDRRAFDDTRIRDKRIRHALITASTARCVIFKPVSDSHRVIELLAEHPGGKGIWLHRDYQDVANSAVERWGDTVQRFIEDLLEGGGDWGFRLWNREKVTEESLAELREAAAGGLNPHAAAALFWHLRNRTFFEQRLERNPGVLLAKYEDLVTEPEGEFQRLCHFLNIRYEPEMVEEVKATSIRKRPLPQVDERIHALCRGMMERLDAVGRNPS